MKRPIFLSASIPCREPFTKKFDPLAIREAVIALVAVTIRERPLVFGGHPAISPLVEHAGRSLGALERIHIYQSRFFEDKIPEVARQFENLHWTVNKGTEDFSLEEMRTKMLTAWDFSAAVFIGGMEGIFDEERLFRRFHQGKPMLAIGSTGGAAAMLLNDMRNSLEEKEFAVLQEERRYRRLFRKLLPDQ